MLDGAAAGDRAGKGRRVGALEDERAGVGHVTDEGAGGAAVAELEGAAADGGAAGVGVVAGEDDGVAADLGDRTRTAGVVLDDAGEGGRVRAVTAEGEGGAAAGGVAEGDRAVVLGVVEITKTQTGLVHHRDGVGCLHEVGAGLDTGSGGNRELAAVVADERRSAQIGAGTRDEHLVADAEAVDAETGSDVFQGQLTGNNTAGADISGDTVEHQFTPMDHHPRINGSTR